LFVLGLSYVHQATSGFALPALLPMISPELGLSDFQGALLTSGYSYLYALALVPVGLLADKVRLTLLVGHFGVFATPEYHTCAYAHTRLHLQQLPCT
jgi:MFS family permease